MALAQALSTRRLDIEYDAREEAVRLARSEALLTRAIELEP